MSSYNNPYMRNPNYKSPLDRLNKWWNDRKEMKKFSTVLSVCETSNDILEKFQN